LQDVRIVVVFGDVRYRVYYECVATVTRVTPSPGPVHTSCLPPRAAAVLAKAVKGGDAGLHRDATAEKRCHSQYIMIR
jgi:hypothetical protein